MLIARRLVNKFKEISPQLEADIALLNSAGQVAVECVPKSLELANQWLAEWVADTVGEDEVDVNLSSHVLTLYDFLTACSVLLDSHPELANEIIQLESVFIPPGPQLVVAPSPPPTRGGSSKGNRRASRSTPSEGSRKVSVGNFSDSGGDSRKGSVSSTRRSSISK